MKAMILHGLTDLRLDPEPLVYGILPNPVPGHQAGGRIEALGSRVSGHRLGDRVGVAWNHSACGVCRYCLEGNENLFSEFMATGRDAHGGYAELLTVPADHAFPIPGIFTDEETAPLLCAGAIGYRSLRLIEPSHESPPLRGKELQGGVGLTGFGASTHLVLKMIRHQWPGINVYVFARNGTERDFALELGASWAGDTTDTPPGKMDAIIDTTPVWKPVKVLKIA